MNGQTVSGLPPSSGRRKKSSSVRSSRTPTIEEPRPRFDNRFQAIDDVPTRGHVSLAARPMTFRAAGPPSQSYSNLVDNDSDLNPEPRRRLKKKKSRSQSSLTTDRSPYIGQHPDDPGYELKPRSRHGSVNSITSDIFSSLQKLKKKIKEKTFGSKEDIKTPTFAACSDRIGSYPSAPDVKVQPKLYRKISNSTENNSLTYDSDNSKNSKIKSGHNHSGSYGSDTPYGANVVPVKTKKKKVPTATLR